MKYNGNSPSKGIAHKIDTRCSLPTNYITILSYNKRSISTEGNYRNATTEGVLGVWNLALSRQKIKGLCLENYETPPEIRIKMNLITLESKNIWKLPAVFLPASNSEKYHSMFFTQYLLCLFLQNMPLILKTPSCVPCYNNRLKSCDTLHILNLDGIFVSLLHLNNVGFWEKHMR